MELIRYRINSNSSLATYQIVVNWDNDTEEA